ncbi:MAG: type II toxin-antitoxin system Phd/YefM family antitoxin [Bifidobacteriaceae bacterium]|nr:type II toxin-antitoxin system Phd/YefM family antitoxin [Bifidobacteriaceae bacterium]
MSEKLIGIRELQRDASRVVRSVEEDGAMYRVTVRGRPIDVVLSTAPSLREPGASVARARASNLYTGVPADVAALWVAEVEGAREAQGRLGEDS